MRFCFWFLRLWDFSDWQLGKNGTKRISKRRRRKNDCLANALSLAWNIKTKTEKKHETHSILSTHKSLYIYTQYTNTTHTHTWFGHFVYTCFRIYVIIRKETESLSQYFESASYFLSLSFFLTDTISKYKMGKHT